MSQNLKEKLLGRSLKTFFLLEESGKLELVKWSNSVADEKLRIMEGKKWTEIVKSQILVKDGTPCMILFLGRFKKEAGTCQNNRQRCSWLQFEGNSYL